MTDAVAPPNPVPAPEPSPFAALNARLADLASGPGLPPGDGLRPLAEGIWLAVEPGRGAAIALVPAAEGLRLALHDAARARWASLSMVLPPAPLARGRQIVLGVRAASGGFFSFRPCLRYIRADGGFDDRFADDYSLSSGGLRQHMAAVAIDHGLLAGSARTELHVFFQGADFEADLLQTELFLLI